jgi:hypothetical protein
MTDEMPLRFGDAADAEAVKAKLGRAERARLRALMAGRPVGCHAHPGDCYAAPDAQGRICPCENNAVTKRFYDEAERRQRERDDARTGLTVEQREALLGGLAAMYSAGAKAKGRSGLGGGF